MQEVARKDIERAFGVLQSRFAIVRGPARFWDKKTLKNIMTCCVMLHNTIIEDEGGMAGPIDYEPNVRLVRPRKNPNYIQEVLEVYQKIKEWAS